MSRIILDTDGSILEIRTDGNSGLLHVVPASYPETYSWDVAAQSFVADPAKALAKLRAERNLKLDASDKMAMPDRAALDRAPWLIYRQALRDLPETTVDAFNPVWPIAP